jgi:hypothetical protein
VRFGKLIVAQNVGCDGLESLKFRFDDLRCNQYLHRPLHAKYKKEITQFILAMSGIGPTQLDANPQVGRQ